MRLSILLTLTVMASVVGRSSRNLCVSPTNAEPCAVRLRVSL